MRFSSLLISHRSASQPHSCRIRFQIVRFNTHSHSGQCYAPRFQTVSPGICRSHSPISFRITRRDIRHHHSATVLRRVAFGSHRVSIAVATQFRCSSSRSHITSAPRRSAVYSQPIPSHSAYASTGIHRSPGISNFVGQSNPLSHFCLPGTSFHHRASTQTTRHFHLSRHLFIFTSTITIPPGFKFFLHRHRQFIPHAAIHIFIPSLSILIALCAGAL